MLTRPRCFTMLGFMPIALQRLRPIRVGPIGPLETLEGLEQLRFLENGRAVAVRRSAGARAAVLGIEQPRRRATDRGDDGRDGRRMTPVPVSLIIVSRHRTAALLRAIRAVRLQDHRELEADRGGRPCGGDGGAGVGTADQGGGV